MRVLFVAADRAVAAAATATLCEGGVEGKVVETLETANVRDIDAVLLWHQALPKMVRARRLQLLHLPSRVPIIVAMRIEDALTMPDDTLFADGIVFVDANLSRLVEIVHLTRAGYMLGPKDLTPDRLESSARVAQQTDIGGLSPGVPSRLGQLTADPQN